MPLDLSNPIELTVSQAALTQETNDGRFENFSRDVVSVLEGGATIFSTSFSWDLGRDGVGAGKARGIYICATLRDDVDQKALNDLERISSTTRDIQRIYFCSSQRLSEHKKTLLEAQLSSEIDGKYPITVLGATQLTEAVASRPEVVERYYAAEIQGALRAISSDPSDESEVHGLRLALIAAVGDNSSDIRQALYHGGLLSVLRDGTPRSLTNCAKALSDSLHLHYVISDVAVQPHLSELVTSGYVETNGPVYNITAAGANRANELHVQAADRFLGGRLAVRKALEEAIGERLDEDSFARIWSVFEARLAAHFHSRGVAMVAEVSALLEAMPAKHNDATKPQLSFLEELATAVAHTATHPQRRAELRQSVIDLFSDRSSGATDWLVRVSASFVACCALGLEQSTGTALARLLARTALVFDSDVVLSLLGEGEPEHESVFAIASKWIRVGGKVLVAEPVLEEVAYHAHIAQHDFDQVVHLLPGTVDDRLHIVENAFVRSFAEHMTKSGTKVSQWGRFISQYRGSSPYEWGPVMGHLRAEYSVGALPHRTAELEALERNVRTFLIHTAEQRGYSGKSVRDKASRDARLYAQMVQYLQSIRAMDPGATCLLVSSARRLSEAENAFHESGEQQIVVPISTVLHLLSLLPQVSLGLSAMKAFLFEERRPGFSSDLERTILRLVRTSAELTMPWAKRGALMREVRDRLIDDARKQGRNLPNDANTSALERTALDPENKPRTIQILADALDKVAVRTRLEGDNARLRRENEALQKQLEQSRSPSRRGKA
jgi:hypothetical protein